MQPTHVKWEHIPTPSEHLQIQQQQQKKTIAAATPHGTHAANQSSDPSPSPSNPTTTIFTPIPALISRNYLISDTYFTSPQLPNTNLIPGPDGDINDLGPNGLSGISQAVLDELPAECREAFAAARDAETTWKSGWGNEGIDGGRGGGLKIGFNGFPV